MSDRNFENETKWCPTCKSYKRYLMSVDHSYCIECGTKMRLFNEADASRFAEDIQKRRFRVTGS